VYCLCLLMGIYKCSSAGTVSMCLPVISTWTHIFYCIFTIPLYVMQRTV